MKKSKMSLSPLQLKKETIAALSNAGQVYGGATITQTPACLTKDPANTNCIHVDTIKNTCTCPVQTTPLYTC